MGGTYLNDKVAWGGRDLNNLPLIFHRFVYFILWMFYSYFKYLSRFIMIFVGDKHNILCYELD